MKKVLIPKGNLNVGSLENLKEDYEVVRETDTELVVLVDGAIDLSQYNILQEMNEA